MRRVLLKLSGEALAGQAGFGIDPGLTCDEVLARGLQVMDQTAICLCRDQAMFVGGF